MPRVIAVVINVDATSSPNPVLCKNGDVIEWRAPNCFAEVSFDNSPFTGSDPGEEDNYILMKGFVKQTPPVMPNTKPGEYAYQIIAGEGSTSAEGSGTVIVHAY